MYGELPEIQVTNGEPIRGFAVQILNPPKTAVLRLPTNEEMTDYLSKQKTIHRSLGRRKNESESVLNPEADLALFTKIRLDKGEEFDADEAGKAISRLTQQRVVSCERDGDGYVITLATVFGKTTHSVGIPTEKDLALYRRGVYKSTELPHGVEERRYPPAASTKLYDAVVKSQEGYACPVPPHHKASIVLELVQAIEELDPDMDLDPNS